MLRHVAWSCLSVSPFRARKPYGARPVGTGTPSPSALRPLDGAAFHWARVPSSSRRDFLRAKLLEKEADLMKDVPDWEVGASVYKTRHMKPMEQIGVLPSSIFGIPK